MNSNLDSLEFSKSKFHAPRKKLFWLDNVSTYHISTVIIILALLLIIFILSTLLLSIYHLICYEPNEFDYNESVTTTTIKKSKSKYPQISNGKKFDWKNVGIEVNQTKTIIANGKKIKTKTNENSIQCLKSNLNDLLQLSPKKFVPQN